MHNHLKLCLKEKPKKDLGVTVQILCLTALSLKLTWCQFRADMLIFLTEPGESLLISLKQTKNIEFSDQRSSVFGSHFPDLISKDDNIKGSVFRMSHCPRCKGTRMAPLWKCDIFVERSSAKVLTGTEWLHSSALSGSLGLWVDRWLHGSTASAPLLFEGHTSEQSAWVEMSKRSQGKKGKLHACIHSVSLVATSDTRSWETTLQLGDSSTWTKIINQSGKTETDLWLILCDL